MKGSYKALYKRIFYSLWIISSIILIVLAWDAPISGDEYVHFEHAQKVNDYFQSGRTDKRVLDTPVSFLKHYGQSFDNLTALMSDVLKVENAVRFRHVSNAIATALLLLFTALLAHYVTGRYLPAILTLALLMVSPRFIGHAINNLKDIPFALGYIASIYFSLRVIDQQPRPRWQFVLGLALSIAFSVSIRIGGVLIICYLGLFQIVHWGRSYYSGMAFKPLLQSASKAILILIPVVLCAYFIGLLYWPWAWEDFVFNPINSLKLIHNYPTKVRQIFEGKLYWSEVFPWYYLFKYIVITIPLSVIAGLLASFALVVRRPGYSRLNIAIIAFTVLFPLCYASITGANVYGAWRQMLFVYPSIIVLAALGIDFVLVSFKPKAILVTWVVLLVFLSYGPVAHMIRNAPYYYIYFNELVGGVKGAYGRYELDYYFTGYHDAFKWLTKEVKDSKDTVIIGTNFIIPWYVEDLPMKQQYFKYHKRGNYNWDYAVLSNTFLTPELLQSGHFPLKNSVYKVEVDGMPVCIVVKRGDKPELDGLNSMKDSKYDEAISYFKMALENDPACETHFENIVQCFEQLDDFTQAEAYLDKLLEVRPGYEWAVYKKAEYTLKFGQPDKSIRLLEENIDYNYKHFNSYTLLASSYLTVNQVGKAKQILFKCLKVNGRYRPALDLLANIYQLEGKEEWAKYYKNYSR